MIHYHGGPITPETCALRAWRRGHAFISWASHGQIKLAASVCESFAIDNGAFSIWKRDQTSRPDWNAYYDFCEEWLAHPACDWAVIPDVIGGTEEENDALLSEWPHSHAGVPVWHLNESPERLVRIAQSWPRIALGSAAEFDVSRPSLCLGRLASVLPLICNSDGRPVVKLHGLRMLRPQIVSKVPLSSADSTNIARNVGIDKRWRGPYAPATNETRTDVIRERIEMVQAPDRMTDAPEDLHRLAKEHLLAGEVASTYDPPSAVDLEKALEDSIARGREEQREAGLRLDGPEVA